MNITAIIAAAIFMLLSCPSFAGYPENIKNGKAAFMSGNYKWALYYYKEAFLEKPDAKTGELIMQLEKMTGAGALKKESAGTLLPTPEIAQPAAAHEMTPQEPVTPQTQPPERKGRVYPSSVFMAMADFIALGVLAYTYANYNNSVDEYNGMRLIYDNTNYAGYEKLLSKQDEVYSKQGGMITAACVAGAAVAYTFVDAFWLHAVFPVNMELDFGKNGMRVSAGIKKEFK